MRKYAILAVLVLAAFASGCHSHGSEAAASGDADIAARLKELRAVYRDQIQADPRVDSAIVLAVRRNIDISEAVRIQEDEAAAKKATKKEEKTRKDRGSKSRKCPRAGRDDGEEEEEEEDRIIEDEAHRSEEDKPALAGKLDENGWRTIKIEKPARESRRKHGRGPFSAGLKVYPKGNLLVEAVALGIPGHSFELLDKRDRVVMKMPRVHVRGSSSKHGEASFDPESNSFSKYHASGSVVIKTNGDGRKALRLRIQERSLPGKRRYVKRLRGSGEAGVAVRVSELEVAPQHTKMFFLVTTPVPFDQTEAVCQAFNGTLAEISTSNAVEATQLVQTVLGSKGLAYVGKKHHSHHHSTYFIEASGQSSWADEKHKRDESRRHSRHHRHSDSDSDSFTQTNSATQSAFSSRIRRAYLVRDKEPTYGPAPVLCAVRRRHHSAGKDETKEDSGKDKKKSK